MRQARYLIALLATVAGPGQAFATSCSESAGYQKLTLVQIGTLIASGGGGIVCYPAAGPFTNQEFHNGGIIGDYKMGPSDPNDPALSNIGGYALGGGPGGGTITYFYTGGGNGPTYDVWGAVPPASGSYDFCVGTTPITVRVKYQAGAIGAC